MKEKKCIIAILLFCCFNFSLALCATNDIEFKTMKSKPCYEFTGNESIDEMRKRTVQVMRDTLTLLWSPKESFSYNKTNAGSGNYQFNKGQLYANLPYTSGFSGLFQWLHFYNYQTGIFDYDDWQNVGKKLGNSCAASVIWSVSATCSSISKGQSIYTSTMTLNNGWQPLGKYLYPKDIDTYANIGTNVVIAQNSKSIIFESYALLDKADILVSCKKSKKFTSTAGHAMMSIDKPIVVRNPRTKSIDGEKSFVLVQEQDGGQDRVITTNGQSVSLRGYIYKKYSFDYLHRKNYIPMTTLEFKGTKPFEKSYCKLDGNFSDFDSLQKCRIKSNYRLAVIVCEIRNMNGSIIFNTPYTLKGSDIVKGIGHDFPINKYLTSKVLKTIKNKKNIVIKLWVTLSTGKDCILLDCVKI